MSLLSPWRRGLAAAGPVSDPEGRTSGPEGQRAAGSEQVVESGRMMMKLAFLSRPRAGLAVKNLE